MNAKERILQYIDFKELSKREFYLNTGLSNGFLDKVFNIGSDKLEIILLKYPELNPTWVLTGKGEMLLEPTDVITIKKNEVIERETTNDFYPNSYELLHKLLGSNAEAQHDYYKYAGVFVSTLKIKDIVHLYNLENRMYFTLDSYLKNQIGKKELMEGFKTNISVMQELLSILEPYKTILNELAFKVSDFNNTHDKLFWIGD